MGQNGHGSGLADHPRVRGEQGQAGWFYTHSTGSPPRARGVARLRGAHVAEHRITPACAGSSRSTSTTFPPPRDHPRVRGEQPVLLTVRAVRQGSPPRARGAVRAHRWGEVVGRITPACAGSSQSAPTGRRRGWDHPRVRGEQELGHLPVGDGAGSPPRARGAVRGWPAHDRDPGITPACAGSSDKSDPKESPAVDHPRVRGEQVHAFAVTVGFTGITPACAGSSVRCAAG